MGESPSSPRPGLHATEVRQLEAICDRFEKEWRSGRCPSIEGHLAGVSESQHGRLLYDLLQLDLDYRFKLGEQPTPQDYLTVFGLHADSIHRAFADLEEHYVRSEVLDQPLPEGAASTSPIGAASEGTTSLKTVRTLGDFELLNEIGRGGMGVVYRARQISLDRMVALKLPHRGMIVSDEEEQRFRLVS